jgi:hypothetical protein
MTSKFELRVKVREAIRDLLVKPPGKMKKHELEHTLAALTAKGDVKATISEPAPAAGRPPPRPVPTTSEGDIRVPLMPKERVTALSTAAEKNAYRESVGVPKTFQIQTKEPKPSLTRTTHPKGVIPPGLAAYHAKRKAEKEAALLAAAPAPAPLERTKPAPKPKAPKEPKAPKATPPPPPVEDDTDPKAVRIVRPHAVPAEKKAAAAKPAGGAGTDSDAMMTAFQEFLKQRKDGKVEVGMRMSDNFL